MFLLTSSFCVVPFRPHKFLHLSNAFLIQLFNDIHATNTCPPTFVPIFKIFVVIFNVITSKVSKDSSMKISCAREPIIFMRIYFLRPTFRTSKWLHEYSATHCYVYLEISRGKEFLRTKSKRNVRTYVRFKRVAVNTWRRLKIFENRKNFWWGYVRCKIIIFLLFILFII